MNAASRRVQGLDRFSQSAPIGRPELATIVLQGLAELGAYADRTVTPGITDSIIHLLNDAERKRYEEFHESVRRAAAKAGPADAHMSSPGAVSESAVTAIDPGPPSDSRTATLDEVISDEDLGRRAAEAIVYQLYHEIFERAVILVERSAAA